MMLSNPMDHVARECRGTILSAGGQTTKSEFQLEIRSVQYVKTKLLNSLVTLPCHLWKSCF